MLGTWSRQTAWSFSLGFYFSFAISRLRGLTLWTWADEEKPWAFSEGRRAGTGAAYASAGTKLTASTASMFQFRVFW